MTFEENIKFLKNINTLYPNEKTQDEDALKIKATMWASILADISYRQAMEALKNYCATSMSGFAPQPAHILNFVRQKTRLSDAAINFYLNRALCDSTYHAEEQFERLPDDLKKIIGSPAELQRQAAREQDDTKIYIARICKEYRARVDGGTLDNTLLISGDEQKQIRQTMARLGGVLNGNG